MIKQEKIIEALSYFSEEVESFDDFISGVRWAESEVLQQVCRWLRNNASKYALLANLLIEDLYNYIDGRSES